jgi:hypothetical protein
MAVSALRGFRFEGAARLASISETVLRIPFKSCAVWNQGLTDFILESSTSHLSPIHLQVDFGPWEYVTGVASMKGSILLAKFPDFHRNHSPMTDKQMFPFDLMRSAYHPFEKGGSRSDRFDSAGPASGIPLSLTRPARRLYFPEGQGWACRDLALLVWLNLLSRKVGRHSLPYDRTSGV